MSKSEKRYELWTIYPAGDDRNPHLGSFDTMAELIPFAQMLPQNGQFEVHDNTLKTIQAGEHYKALFHTNSEPM